MICKPLRTQSLAGGGGGGLVVYNVFLQSLGWAVLVVVTVASHSSFNSDNFDLKLINLYNWATNQDRTSPLTQRLNVQHFVYIARRQNME